MVVQHNLQAMNANRMLKISAANLSSTSEKLSSGYRINRAADDAAGLSISEKMRKQIRGLTQGSSNAEDGISSVQTAEGALQEVTDMLQRMNELCVQAANGTASATDRQYIQDEIDELVSEVNRVAETTKFNDIYLLKGDLANGTTNYYTANYKTTSTISKLYDSDGAEVTAMALSDYFDEKGNYLGGLFTTAQASVADEVYTDRASIARGAGAHKISDYVSLISTKVSNELEFQLQVGADSADANQIDVSISTLTAAGLGVDKLHSSLIGIVDDTGANATEAINVVAAAIQKISTQRSALGAIQNRLEHTVKNLDNIVENTTASESQIRDTDMAKEMVSYSNTNILTQAGTSMLSQANQANQGILSILQ